MVGSCVTRDSDQSKAVSDSCFFSGYSFRKGLPDAKGMVWLDSLTLMELVGFPLLRLRRGVLHNVQALQSDRSVAYSLEDLMQNEL